MIDALALPTDSVALAGLIAALVASYLLGAVPFGLVLTRAAGLGDIRDIGSGNIGATNVLRTGRKDLAALTLLLDAGKGGIAALLCATAFDTLWVPAAAGAAAFLGHCYPVWLKFQGGKGVATFFGTLIAVNPLVFVAAGLSWLATAFLFRMSSLGALVASAVAPVAAVLLDVQATAPFILAMTVLIYIRHRDNIGRILQGIEPRIGSKSAKSADTDETTV